MMKRTIMNATGLAALVLSGPVAADIIYSNYLNTTIATNFTGTDVNVDVGTLNLFFGGAGVANNSAFQPFRTGTGGLDTMLGFDFGDTIDSGAGDLASGSGGSTNHLGTQFTGGVESYLGFELSGANYGWMRGTFTYATSGAVIKDWAYDDSGGAIKAGLIQTDVTSGSLTTTTLNADVADSFAVASALTNGVPSGLTNSVVKVGDGTVTLKGTNTYTGNTNVDEGTLAIDGTTHASSAFTVADGATLTGSGSIGGSVTIQAGGTLSSGDIIESLATGALTLQNLAIFYYEMDNDAAASAAGDLTAITGNLTITNGAILSLDDLGMGTWDVGDKLTLISYSGTWNGGLFNYGGTLADDSTFFYSGMQWLFNYNDTVAGTNFTDDLTGTSFVTMTAIPEPAAALLGGLGVLLLLRRRR